VIMPTFDYSAMMDEFTRIVTSSGWGHSLETPAVAACYECEQQSRNMLVVDGNRLCVDCHSRQHIQCTSCAVMVPRTSVPEDRIYNFVCETCISQYIPCHVCQTRFHPRNGYEIPLADGTNVQVCGGTCEGTIRRMCTDCGQFHHLPFERCLTKYPELPTDYIECYLPNRQFSVELETSKVLDNPIGWTSVTDGSVSGREYLSGPILGKTGIALIESGCASLNQDGPVVDNKCGYHIHLNARDLSEEQVAKFLKLCFKYQDDVVKIVPRSRSFDKNKYCARLPDRFGTSIPLEEMIYPRRDGYGDSDHRRYMVESKKYKYYDGRYFWANAHSYYYRGTIEIRLHSGTTLPDRILNWAELWLKLLEYAVSPDTDGTYFGRANFFKILERAKVREETIEFYKSRQKKFYGEAVALSETGRRRNSVANMGGPLQWVNGISDSPTYWTGYDPETDPSF